MRLVFLIFLFGISSSAHAGWFGPKNYDECILENMKGVTLKEAVWAIQNSCRAKFPEACYAWQKAHNEYVKTHRRNPWEKHARPTDLEMMPDTSAGSAPEGCEVVLR